jgi:hypothetical protein
MLWCYSVLLLLWILSDDSCCFTVFLAIACNLMLWCYSGLLQLWILNDDSCFFTVFLAISCKSLCIHNIVLSIFIIDILLNALAIDSVHFLIPIFIHVSLCYWLVSQPDSSLQPHSWFNTDRALLQTWAFGDPSGDSGGQCHGRG